MPAPRCGHRCDRAAVQGEPLAAGVHHRPRPRRRLLAGTAHPQAGASERAHPDRTCPGHRRAADRDRHPRALRLPVQHPAGQHRAARAAVRRLRARGRRAVDRQRGTQITGRFGLQPDQRQAALSGRRSGRAAARGRRRGGPLLTGVQARLGASRRGQRRAGRAADPLAQRADRVLRDPPARRRMDLPIPCRRPCLGDH